MWQRRSQDIPGTKGNTNTIQQNIWDTLESAIRGKFMSRCAYIKNIRKNTNKWFDNKTGIWENKKKTNPDPVDGKK